MNSLIQHEILQITSIIWNIKLQQELEISQNLEIFYFFKGALKIQKSQEYSNPTSRITGKEHNHEDNVQNQV